MDRAWVEDPTGVMTLAEAKQMPEKPFENKYFTRGFSQSTFWLRLHIDPSHKPQMAEDDRLIIRIRPPIQDQIQLFDPLGKSDRVRLTGDYFDWARDEYRSLNLNFVVPVGKAPRDVWLRLRTDQSTMTFVEILTEDEARAADRQQELGTMLYFAALLICLGWGVLSYINQKDRLVGFYIVREVFAIMYALVMLGYFRAMSSGWLPATWLDPISNNLIFVFVTYVIWFDSQFIRLFKPNPWLYRATLALIAALPIEWVLQLMGKSHLAIGVNNYIVILAIFFVWLLAFTTRAWDEARIAQSEEKPVFSKTFLVSVYSIIVGAVLINRLPVMGLITAKEGILYLNLVYSLVSSICMMILVQVRAYRLNKRQQEAQNRLALAEHETAQANARRIEQSNFLKMLAHEMKTPLSVIRMATSRDRLTLEHRSMIDHAIGDMNGVVERLLEVERLEDQRIDLHLTNFDIATKLHNISGQLSGKAVVVLDMPPSLIINTDDWFVHIILTNLLDNAVRYGATGAPIQISLRNTHDQIFISIVNLIGAVGAPDQDKVFDKYYRAPNALKRTGSGLGLYLVRGLLALLGGDISYRQQADSVCFEVRLPIVFTRGDSKC